MRTILLSGLKIALCLLAGIVLYTIIDICNSVFKSTYFTIMANRHMKLGRYEEAERLYRRILESTEKHNGEDTFSYGCTLGYMGNLYQKLGRYEESERLFIRSIELKVKGNGEDNFIHGSSLFDLGNLYENLGRYEEAEGLYRRCLEIIGKHRGESSLSYCTVLHGLANLYLRLGRYEEAEGFYRQCMEIQGKHRREGSLPYGSVLHGLANLYLRLDRYEEAEGFYRRSLEIKGKYHGEESLAYGFSLQGLAVIYAAKGMMDEAMRDFEAVLKIFRKKHRGSTLDVANILDNYAVALARFEKFELAFQQSTEAIQSHLRVLQALHEGINLASFNSVRGMSKNSQHLFLSLLLNQVSVEETYHYLPMLLEIQVGELYVTGLRRKIFEASASEDEYSRYEELVSGLRNLGTQAASEIEGRRSQLLEALQKIWSGVLIRRKGLVPQKGSEEAKASITPLFDAWTTSGFEASVKGVGYMRYYDYIEKEDRYCALLLTTHPFVDSQIYSLGSAAPIEEAAQTLLEAIEAQDLDAQHQTLKELNHLLKAPIEPWLQGTEYLTLSAEGALALLPLELIFEGFQLRHLNSLSDLFWLGQLEKTESADAIILANPDFDLPYFPDNGYANLNTEKPSLSKDSTDYKSNRDFRNVEFPIKPLPGTGEEAQRIGRLLELSYDRIITGDRFVKPAIHDIRNPQILHIATHGLYLPAEDRGKSREDDFLTFEDRASAHDDPYERCFLLASGANQIEFESGAYRHYMITGNEIMNMELSGTRLAVLSACQTGIGEISQSEGVIGMRRAFMLAQVPTIICSLWEVDDRATAILMHRFYSNLMQGLRADASLEEAKRYLRGTTALQLAEEGWSSLREELKDHERPFEAPKYWAAFICIGMGDAIM